MPEKVVIGMPPKLKIQIDRLRHSLRARVALGVALPVLIALVALSLIHYLRARNLVEEQVRQTAIQVGEVTLGSLRHIMMEKDQVHLDQVLLDVGRMEDVQQIMLIGKGNRLAASSVPLARRMISLEDPGCIECHAISPSDRPQASILRASPETLRISTPIQNEPQCQSCHLDDVGHLGILLTDVSLIDSQMHVLRDLQQDMIFATLFTLLITAGVYFLMSRLVVTRFERLQQPMQALAGGSFSVRLPVSERSGDEIDILASNVNLMAEELERHVEEQEERHQIQYLAVVEERERIAREIHDGIAQFLGYVNHKVNAIRLLLQKNNYSNAQTQLIQLSDASQVAFTELRSEILGLRTSELQNSDLISSIESYAEKFGELSGVSVEVHSSRNGGKISLSPDVELHLIRITQEALANIHKHAQTDQAWVLLKLKDQILEMLIGDHGVGFDPDGPPLDSRPHFGLKTMRERAEAIGAKFNIDSSPGEGTRVNIELDMDGKK